ncbi:hypothetical protein BH10BDE1_BH10BDE1_16020 [soil metagenome]
MLVIAPCELKFGGVENFDTQGVRVRCDLKIVPIFLMTLLLSPLIWTSAKAQVAEPLLKRDIAVSTRTVAKEFSIYHYFNLAQVYDELKTPVGRQAYVARYIEQVTEKYWDLSFHASQYINAGPGIYLAVDPYIAYSQKLFGTTMIELKVPVGTRYVSVVQPIPIAKDTLDALINEGYFARYQASVIFYKAAGPTKLGFYRDTLKNMTDPGFEKFRELVQRVFSAANVQFIEYNWDSALTNFCPRRKSVSAFNYIGARPSNGAYRGISMISTDLQFPNPSVDEQEFSARVFKLRGVLEQIQSMRKRGVAVPKDLIVPNTYSATEYKQIKDMTFGCD